MVLGEPLNIWLFLAHLIGRDIVSLCGQFKTEIANNQSFV